jgi:hypothetical protein
MQIDTVPVCRQAQCVLPYVQTQGPPVQVVLKS